MNIKRCFHKTNYPYYHFSSHVYVPEVDAPQLQVDKHHKYIKYLLDDVTCKKNNSEPSSQWDCLLPDWSEKTNFICNGTCIEHCSLIIEADLIKYFLWVQYGLQSVARGYMLILAQHCLWGSMATLFRVFFTKVDV